MDTQVNKIEVQYDKTSKQVDVHSLKETLWDHIQQLNQNAVVVSLLYWSRLHFLKVEWLFLRVYIRMHTRELSYHNYTNTNLHDNVNLFQEEVPEQTISFKQVLSSFPDNCRAAASLNDISPHLCFICLLHLANEHGLRILGCPTMDDLSIHLKPLNNCI